MVDPKIVPRLTFNNGLSTPVVGLGTWQSPPDGSVYRAVKAAIENGYRHLDCAFIYGNQAEIGQAIEETIKAGVVKREDLFVTSKIWLTYYRKDRLPVCFDKILSDLRLEYIDLILLHWPFSFQQQDENNFPTGPDGKVIDGGIDYLEAWQALEPLVATGRVKSIGISNFNEEQIERLLKVAKIVPVTNQVECHPYLAQQKLKEFCEARGIKLTAYSPLGNPGSQYTSRSEEEKKKLIQDPVVNRLAAKYNKNPGQILIKFQAQRGILVIPKSVNTERIVSNLQIWDFELTPEEVQELLALDANYRTCGFDITAHLTNYPWKK